jgi:membrane protein
VTASPATGPASARPAARPRGARASAIAYLRHVTADELPKIAASLTYFLTLSLAPALIIVIALLGLVGVSPHSVARLLESASSVGPQWFVQFVDAALQSVLRTGDNLALLLVGIVLALWTVSGYVAAFLWAAGNVTGVRDTRGFLARLPQRLGLSLVLLVVIDVAVAAVVLVGPVAAWLGRLLGLGDAVVHTWSVLRLPFLIAVGVLWCAILFYAAPAPRRPGLLHTLVGSAVGVAVMIAASAGFSIYLSRFASYQRVYGLLGAAIAALVWAWLLNIGLLMGFEVTAALERRRNRTSAAPPAATRPDGGGAGGL